MTDEYQRYEFWNDIPKKDEISILGKDLFKCSKEELKYLDVRQDSLSKIIRTKEEADNFMNRLNFAIKQGNKK